MSMIKLACFGVWGLGFTLMLVKAGWNLLVNWGCTRLAEISTGVTWNLQINWGELTSGQCCIFQGTSCVSPLAQDVSPRCRVARVLRSCVGVSHMFDAIADGGLFLVKIPSCSSFTALYSFPCVHGGCVPGPLRCPNPRRLKFLYKITYTHSPISLKSSLDCCNTGYRVHVIQILVNAMLYI